MLSPQILADQSLSGRIVAVLVGIALILAFSLESKLFLLGGPL